MIRNLILKLISNDLDYIDREIKKLNKFVDEQREYIACDKCKHHVDTGDAVQGKSRIERDMHQMFGYVYPGKEHIAEVYYCPGCARKAKRGRPRKK